VDKMKRDYKSDKLHALLWGIFSVGGIIAAFLLPVLIFVSNIAYPLGLWPAANISLIKTVFIVSLLAAIFVFVTIGGSLFHAIFRFKTTLPELGLKRASSIISAVGYIIITAGLISLVYYLFQLYQQFDPSLFHRIV
jgi:fumarate reductase subunit D